VANNFNKPKATLAEVQAQAESDFLSAAANLPVSYDDANVEERRREQLTVF